MKPSGRYATEANSDGAPTQDEMATANFDLPREFRQCNLDPFIEGAQSSGNSYAAIYLAELQLWWDPCWSNLQVLSSLCSEEQASMRRQQLQTLMINDSTCRCGSFLACIISMTRSSSHHLRRSHLQPSSWFCSCVCFCVLILNASF